MEVIKGTTQIEIKNPTAISFGKFDGLHVGHKLLVEMLIRKKMEGLEAVAFSFDTPPSAVVGEEKSQLLTTNEEKFHVFENTGIDYLIEYPFTKEMMSMEPEDFLKWIVKSLHVKAIIVGTDFRFGYKRRGDITFLEDKSAEYGYQLNVVQKVQYKNEDISSTRIREALMQGEMEEVENMLGYPFFLSGAVQNGKRIGRTIGFPTMNIHPDKEKLLPPNGVYASRIFIDEKMYQGITNIGVNPTIKEGNPIVVETFIFDFSQEVYGKDVKVELLHFMRPERKFSSVEELKKQIETDTANVQSYYENITKVTKIC